MKSILLSITLLVISYTAAAQTSAQAELPPFAYCEIIGNHLPSLSGNEVLFDFGQPTKYWRNNWLRDSRGARIVFNSNIEALNYMVGRGWEFVQAYASGEDNGTSHLLLRIETSRLSDEEQQQLLSQPKTKGESKDEEEE